MEEIYLNYFQFDVDQAALKKSVISYVSPINGRGKLKVDFFSFKMPGGMLKLESTYTPPTRYAETSFNVPSGVISN